MLAQLIVSSNPELLKDYLNQQLTDQQIPLQGPDIIYLGQDDKFNLETIKELSQFFSLKPFQQAQRIVVLENADNLNLVAQNALLKTIEELSDRNQLWLLATNTNNLLPTLLSRCQKIELNTATESIDLKQINSILELPLEQQFTKIEKVTDKHQFLIELSQYYRSKLTNQPEYADYAAQLLIAQSWFKQHVNQRAVLEYLLLIRPLKCDASTCIILGYLLKSGETNSTYGRYQVRRKTNPSFRRFRTSSQTTGDVYRFN